MSSELKVLIGKLNPICRLSGSNYATLGVIITIKRPTRQDLIDQGMQPE